MAKNLAQALKTDMPRLPLRKAAEELRKKGRGKDTMLAHITPKEAAMLKARGGRGSINPDTGLPEFDDGFFFDPTPISYQPADFSSFEPPSYTPETITQGPVYQAPTQDYTFLSQPSQGFEQPFQAAQYTGYFQPDISSGSSGSLPTDQYAQATPAEIAQGRADVQNAYRTRYAPLSADVALKAYGTPGSDIGGGEAIKAAAQQQQVLTPVEGGLTEQDRQEIERQIREDLPAVRADERAAAQLAAAEKEAAAELEGQPIDLTTKVPSTGGVQTPFGTLSLKDALAIAGVGLGGLSYLNARNQAKDYAAKIQNAANIAAQQQAQLAQPYMTQGGQQLATAVQGGLSPAAMQQFQAAQARTAQGVASSGGVGAVQAGMSQADLYQRLRSQDQANALALLGAGTPIMGQSVATQFSGTNAGLQAQLAQSQAAGQAAMGLFGALAKLYG